MFPQTIRCHVLHFWWYWSSHQDDHWRQEYRVAFDGLFNRIKFDPEIQFKHMDAKHPVADTLIKGNLTRDVWSHLFRLFNISFITIQTFSCNRWRKRVQDGTRAKRANEGQDQRRICFAKFGEIFSCAKGGCNVTARRRSVHRVIVWVTTQHRVLKCGKRTRRRQPQGNLPLERTKIRISSTQKRVAGDLKIVDMDSDWTITKLLKFPKFIVNTKPKITCSHDVKVCNNLATGKLTITECSLTTSAEVDYKIQKERTLHVVLRLRGETEHNTNDNVTTEIQSIFHTVHMNLNTWMMNAWSHVRIVQ